MYREYVSLLSPGQLAPQVSYVMYTFLLLLVVLISIFDLNYILILYMLFASEKDNHG